MDKQKEENNNKESFKTIFTNTIKKYIKNYWWKLLIIAFLFAIDLITKGLIVKFDSNGNVVPTQAEIIKDVLYIWPTANEGAAWSILYGKTVFLIILTVVFLAMIIIYDVCFKKKSVFFGISTSMIVAGALGNLFDRIAFGKVRDFIYYSPIDFPIFNVADICLTVGITLFAIYMIVSMAFEKHKEAESQKEAESAADAGNIENIRSENEVDVKDKNNNLSQNGSESEKDGRNNIDTNSQNNIDNAGDDNAKNNG